MKNFKKIKRISLTIIGVIVGLIIASLLKEIISDVIAKKHISNQEEISFDKTLVHTVNQINSICPIMVDEETRMDNAVVLPNKTIQYNYTFVNLNEADFDNDIFQDYMLPKLINSIKTNPDVKIYKENKATIIYNYSDMNSKYLTRIIITPEMYLE